MSFNNCAESSTFFSSLDGFDAMKLSAGKQHMIFPGQKKPEKKVTFQEISNRTHWTDP